MDRGFFVTFSPKSEKKSSKNLHSFNNYRIFAAAIGMK